MTVILSGLILGFAFGFVLEGAGFANPERLTGQLRFSNWAVFKVMFTAIIVSAFLIYGARSLGLIKLSDIFVPSVYFWGTLLGGAGVGIGMAVGGYCPGTSAVAMASGRFDGFAFLIGIGVGTLLFNGAYPSIHSWIYAQTGPDALTLPHLLRVSPWFILIVLLAALAAIGWTVGAEKSLGHSEDQTDLAAKIGPAQPKH